MIYDTSSDVSKVIAMFSLTYCSISSKIIFGPYNMTTIQHDNWFVVLYICVYLPTQGNVKHICTDRFNLLEEDICMFQSKGRVLLLGDFNARVGKSNDLDYVIGMFGEASSNSNGKLLLNYYRIVI